MIDNNKTDHIEIRSDEVQELIMKVPHGIIRWGTSFIAFFIIFLVISSFLFKYPDVIKANIILTTQNPPVKLIAKISGQIEIIFVQDSQWVKKGDFIALLETAADYEDVFAAKRLCDSLMENNVEGKTNKIYKLGEIQSYFSSFIKDFNDYCDFISLNYHQKKINSLKQELLRYGQYYEKLEEQSKIQEKEYQLTLKQYKRDSLLFHQGVFSLMDIEKSESVLMNKFFAFKETETNLASAKIEVLHLNQQVMDLELFYDEERKERQNQVMEKYNRLQAEIEIWKKKYMIISPVDGKVSFTDFWSVNQQVNEGDIVVTLVPYNTGKILGKISLKVDGAGKVKKGQQVNIKFSNYPYIEFGMVKGIISSLSPVPEKNFYNAEVELTKGLLTNYGTLIEFRQEMPGEAEIITEKLSLMKRIINPVKSSLKKHIE